MKFYRFSKKKTENFGPKFLFFIFSKKYLKVIDADRVLCVENVTQAFRDNDTTVLSAYPPNQGGDIFAMPMDGELRLCLRFSYPI